MREVFTYSIVTVFLEQPLATPVLPYDLSKPIYPPRFFIVLFLPLTRLSPISGNETNVALHRRCLQGVGGKEKENTSLLVRVVLLQSLV